jgi:hypothetical protein
VGFSSSSFGDTIVQGTIRRATFVLHIQPEKYKKPAQQLAAKACYPVSITSLSADVVSTSANAYDNSIVDEVPKQLFQEKQHTQ